MSARSTMVYADGDDACLQPIDQRWRLDRVRAIAGIIFVLALIATVVIVNGGDSASTSATVVVRAQAKRRAPRPSAPWRPVLPPETVTTVDAAAATAQPGEQATSTAPVRDPATCRGVPWCHRT